MLLVLGWGPSSSPPQADASVAMVITAIDLDQVNIVRTPTFLR